MDRFLADAGQIMAVARKAISPDAAILVGPEGVLRMCDPTGWRADQLLAESGARAVYLVHREGDKVRVEGRSLERRCLLESAASNDRVDTAWTATRTAAPPGQFGRSYAD